MVIKYAIITHVNKRLEAKGHTICHNGANERVG